ncbi:MAG: ABC transporter transmembrane domain-containing protein, partial [Eubacteriales bacterium]|nr:ABC transporter transmembrane domain-containing protein [Eubacteriales bacterium]
MSGNNKASFSLKTWKQVMPIVLRHKGHVAIAIVTNMALAGIDLIIPLLQSRAVDDFIMQNTTAGFGGFLMQYGLLFAAELLLLVLYFKNCMAAEMYIGRDLKEACFLNLQRLSIGYYNVTSAGHSLSRVMSDTDRIAGAAAWTFPNILWALAYIPGTYIVLLQLHAPLAMTMIVLAPVAAALTVYFQRRLLTLNREVRAQHSRITAGYNEGIMGAKTSKTMALEGKLTDEFEEITAKAARAGILHGRMRAIYVPLIVLCGTIAASVTLFSGGRLVLAGDLSIGVLSAFMTYALSLFQLFRQMATFISQMVSLQANVERVAELITEQPTVTDSPEVIEKYGDCFEPKKENWEDMLGEVEFED